MSTNGINALAAGFREGKDDPVRALERSLAAADAARDDHVLICRLAGAREEAEQALRRHREGRTLGPLDGIPVVVKDCIDVAGERTTVGTRYLDQPAGADAELVRRLRRAGAVILGKANMHELGIQPTGVNPHHGTAVNPWAPDRIPGGSSSGAAVAVASGMAAAAVGTDAGGSIRVPAALNGLVGLKPTYGAVPMDGVARLTEDLDHAGPIGWTVDDVAALFEVLADRKLDTGISAGRVAALADLFEGADEQVTRPVRAAIAEVFGTCPEVRSPATSWAAAVEFVIVSTQAARLIGAELERQAPFMGADTRIILRLGKEIPAEDYRKASAWRQAMRRELEALLAGHDLLLGPAVGSQAPRLHPTAARTGELDTYTMARLAAVTFPANLTGLPACTVPCVREGLPTGLQIIGRPGDEARVLAAARAVEQAFGPRRPPARRGG